MEKNQDFETTITAVLGRHPPGTIFLASVSGGADSTAMLAALAAMRDAPQNLDLRCIHVEHGIRPAAESRGDAGFVRSFCNSLGVPCHVTSIKPGKVAALAKSRGIGIEAAARLYRRRAWQRHLRRLEAEGHSQIRILVAHTADDMRETTLMRILRGSGPSGLAAMPANRGRILRPLISLSRRDVLDYLAEKNIAWREDSTNTDTRFLRNRIRRLLIPHLTEHFPQWGGAITALAQTQSLTAEFIRKEAKRRIKWGPNKAPHQGEPINAPRQGALTDSVSIVPAQDESTVRHDGRLALDSRVRRGPLTDNISIVPAQEKSTVSGDGKPPLGGCARRGWEGGNAALGNGTIHVLSTDTKAFFSQSDIIREEALFQGINKLGIPVKIKHKNIRHFAQGKLTAVDLGLLQIRRDSHYIMILRVPKEDEFNLLSTPHSPLPTPFSSNHYFTLLIIAPGSYNLKGIAIEVADVNPAGIHPMDLHPADGHQNVFLSLLPLVFRPCFDDFPRDIPSATADSAIIAAVDPLGVAAFIGPDGLLRCRENRGKENQAAQNADTRKRYVVRVKVTALKEAAQYGAK